MGGSQQQNSNTRRANYKTGIPPTSDPRSDGLWARGTGHVPQMVKGVVTRSGAGSYDCEVTVFNGFDLVCNVLVPVGSNTFGYTTSAMPLEGQHVLVLVSDLTARKGYILGVIPAADTNLIKGTGTRGNPLHGKRILPDAKVGLEKTAAYSTPMRERQYAAFLNANSQRYVDVIPGEYVLANENDCGLSLGMFSASIMGGMSYVKASRLDSSVRIVSKNFQQYSSSGYKHVFNDNGYITEETKVSVYQGERLGISTLYGQAFKEDGDESKGEYKYQNKVSRQTAKARLKSYVGFLGGLVDKFLLKPDPDYDTLSQNDQPRDSGISQVNVDGAGTLRVRSAGGLYFERYDRIPVPTRTREPWDPEGDRDVTPTPIEPFEWDEDSRVRGLQLADALAWEYGQSYRRFDDFKKDFYTPEEGDLKDPESKWDDIDGSKSADLSKNNLKRCGVYMGVDGSIIIRDNWGSEIVMAGGDVTITARNDIKVTSPKGIAVIGKNVALDAASGIDMAAKDIMMAADKNLHTVADGILLESKSEGLTWAEPGKGSDTVSSGITLKSAKSSVVVSSKMVHMNAETSLDLITGRENNEREGTIKVSTHNMIVRGDSLNVFTPKTGIMVGSGIMTYADSVQFITQSGMSAFQGKNMYLFQSTPTDKSPVPRIKAQVEKYDKQWKRYASFAPFTLKEIEERKFSFRSSKQAETDKSMFTQPAWSTKWSKETEENSVNTKPWEPITLEDVGAEYSKSWPGYDVFQGNSCYKYGDVQNMEKGVAKNRDSLKSSSTIQEGGLDLFPRVAY